MLSLIVAALCHDIGHPGLNNGYMIASQDPLAIRYNDSSVLEHMHANKTFQILGAINTNIVKNLEKNDYSRFRKIVIQSILGTDLQVHFDKLAEFKTQVANRLTFADDKFKIMTLQMCLKCADIGHGAKALDLHKQWTSLITKEFFRQGDTERANNLHVTPLCDRKSIIVSKSQEGFLKVLVKPLFEVWDQFIHQNKTEDEDEHESVKICLTNIDCNIQFWDEEYELFLEGRQTYELDDFLPPFSPLISNRSTTY